MDFAIARVSDGTFLDLDPLVGLVTSVEADRATSNAVA